MKRLMLACALCSLAAPAQERFAGSAALDTAVETAIQKGQIPGAVLIVGQPGKILHRQAYGSRALMPKREKMTVDTIFDAASLTKVVATTSCIMKLFEEGKVRLNDRVTEYLPEFQGGQSEITVRHLLTHFSGLRPDLDLRPEWRGYDTGIQKALIDKPVAAPGARFQYSDINFLLLGEIVRRVSGKSLDKYAEEELFKPLKMDDTRFEPSIQWYSKIAPTEVPAGTDLPIRGVVHDETSRLMGGVAGHAGMFTSANDLSRFAEMMLGYGVRKDVRIFQEATVRKFTSPQSPHDQKILRGLGWDIDSPYSSVRGELFPIGSYGHTGFTGTSLWIDPYNQAYVVLLTNAVHPKRGTPINSLRSRVATIAAANLGIRSQRIMLSSYNETVTPATMRPDLWRAGQVLTGLDVLVRNQFAPLQGKRVGLITNHTGLSRDGKRNIDLMRTAGVRLVALFSPEHGIAGREDRENIGNGRDAASGLPVYSLYSGPNRRPNQQMMRNVDVLVFDIQDVGVRFYTYICTMLNAMEEAAREKKTFVVLDRPNPITGTRVEGPVLDPDLESFIGCFPMPVRHGMTVGELAKLFNGEKKLGLELEVVKMDGWQRGDWFDATGLIWTDPSPNMRSLPAAILYPGVAMLEASENYSVGRGTPTPFEVAGADWIDGPTLARYLNDRHAPGIRVYPTVLSPTASHFAGQRVGGVRFVVTDRDAFHSTRFGLELAAALQHLYPGKINFETNRKLIGNRAVLNGLQRGADARSLLDQQTDTLQSFTAIREQYLLY